MTKKRIAIVGATGFTGSELVRILYHHPDVEVALITSERRAGENFSDVHPFFRGIVDIQLEPVSALETTDIDLAFLALPHGVSMEYAARLLERDFPVIDFSGDFRLGSPETYETWYRKQHVFHQGFQIAVYGLPELYAKSIRNAKLIANPGCYPTSVVLGVAPLFSEDLIDPGFVIADSKSGVTGAGVKAKPVNHFSSVNDNFRAYGVKTHRHTIEIQEQLDDLSDHPVNVQFTPHLLPIDRGILSTVYLKPKSTKFNEQQLKETYRKFYAGAPFIRLLEEPPAVKNVRGTNYCDIFTTFDERTGNILVMSTIDNLVKGAAGQAVQNMNLIFNLDEEQGLNQIPLSP